MTPELLVGIVLLALLDSLNPMSIGLQVYLLLTPRPVARVAAYVLGTYVAYLAGGMLLFLGLDAALRAFAPGPAGPSAHLGMAALGALLVAAGWWLRRSPDAATVQKAPRWLHPAYTLLLGAVMTASDVPTALPLIAAVERLTGAYQTLADALPALGLYVLIYVLPLLALLATYSLLRERCTGLLEAARRGVARWSRPALQACLYLAGALLLVNSAGYFVLGEPLLFVVLR